jgi:hypothetical protein
LIGSWVHYATWVMGRIHRLKSGGLVNGRGGGIVLDWVMGPLCHLGHGSNSQIEIRWSGEWKGWWHSAVVVNFMTMCGISFIFQTPHILCDISGFCYQRTQPFPTMSHKEKNT